MLLFWSLQVYELCSQWTAMHLLGYMQLTLNMCRGTGFGRAYQRKIEREFILCLFFPLIGVGMSYRLVVLKQGTI